MLQRGDDVRLPDMVLAADAVHVLAADIEAVAIERRVAEGVAVTAQALFRDLLQADALDGGAGAEEELVDEGGLEADRVEDLRAAIGLVGRDAHLGHHLQHALADRLDVALDHLLGIDLLGEGALRVLVEQGVEGEIGVDRFGAIAREAAEMVNLARLAGLDHQPGRGAQALADQVVVHRSRRQQSWDRDAVGPDLPVGQDDDVVAAMHGRFGALAEPLQRAFHAGRALARRIGEVDRLGVEAILVMANAADLLEIVIGQDRGADLQALAARGAFQVEDVRPRPDEGEQAHHQLLADRVDRRVRYLREVLLEIGVEQLRLQRERRDRRVGAHRADGLLPGHRHRRHQQPHILGGVAEGLLAIEQRHVRARGPRLDRRQVLQHDLGALQPVLVGVGEAERGLDLVVADDAALLQVDEQHLARLQAPLLDDLLLRDRQHAEFGGKHHEPVIGDEVACRPQAVAVQRRADLLAIGEGDRRRPVPGLHQGGMVFVEGAPLLVHQRVAVPRLRHEHHHGMGQRVAALHQEFERVVEAGGVGLALIGNRPELGDVGAEQLGIDARLAGRHPVDVAAQRVDLAVMRHHPVGVGEAPGREGVGGETLVHQRQRALEALVLQVLEIGPELVHQHHALVDDGAAGHRDGVVFRRLALLVLVDLVRDRLAQDIDLPLELVLVGDVGRPADEELAVDRLGLQHRLAEIGIVHRHVAPAEEVEPLLLHRLRDDLLAHRPAAGVLRHEELADGVEAGLRQRDAERRALLLEEAVRDLGEDAATVAELGVGADGAAMVEVAQDLQALLDQPVALAVLHVGDEADAAGVFLVGGVVEALARRQRRVAHGRETPCFFSTHRLAGRAHRQTPLAGPRRRCRLADKTSIALIAAAASPPGTFRRREWRPWRIGRLDRHPARRRGRGGRSRCGSPGPVRGSRQRLACSGHPRARVLRRRFGLAWPGRACLQAVVLRTARVRSALASLAWPLVMLASVATARPEPGTAIGRRDEKWDSNTVLSG